MHLDDERIQRLLDGEMAGAALRAAREHPTACADCRRRVAEAERENLEMHALLRRLDHPTPAVDEGALFERSGKAGWSRAPRALQWAAGIAIAVGIVGAAYAFPGSPVPAWIETLVERATGRGGRVSEGAAPGAGTADTPTAGIAVKPGQSMLVEFAARQPQGSVRVTPSDQPMLVVRAPAGAATFTSDADRIGIDNQGSTASFEILIPRAAPRVEVRVAGTTVYRWVAGAATPAPVPTDPGGSATIPLSTPSP